MQSKLVFVDQDHAYKLTNSFLPPVIFPLLRQAEHLPNNYSLCCFTTLKWQWVIWLAADR